MAVTLKEKQLASLRHMILLNNNTTVNSSGDPVFSILVYDRHGQDIIAPLLSVKQLRQMGVTLHLLLHSDRSEVPDVPAIYFCQATEENLTRIAQDFSSGLYTSYYLNFSTPISRRKMEDLAQAALIAGVQADIKRVYDQFVNFISVEEDLFTLKHQGADALSYYSLHRKNVQDTDIDPIIDTLVEGLFSVFVNLGQVPIIRSQRNNAAQAVAERLDRKLRDTLRDTRNNFFNAITSQGFQTGNLSFHRPLLIIVDRNTDLATPLHHPWTYQALCHDLLGMSLNRITLKTASEEQGGVRPKRDVKEYDLGPEDIFWTSHKGSPFPNVAAAVEQELEDYKAAESRVKGLKTDLPQDMEGVADLLLADNTAKLTEAITSLPGLQKKKNNIDRHMSIAMALLENIKKRKLDVFFETEEKIMGRASLEKPLKELLAETDLGNPNDKLRLFLIHYLCAASASTSATSSTAGAGATAGTSEADINSMLEILVESGADTSPVNFLKQWRNIMKLSSNTGMSPPDYGGGIAKTASMFSKLLNQGSALVVEGVKNFVLKENKLPLTRIVDNLMELKSCDEDKEYTYLDPKLLRPQDANNTNARARTPFQDCIVFVVGGGCYTEYNNLRAYAERKSSSAPTASPSPRRLVYGTSELLSPESFLNQLSKLGREISS